VSARPVLTLRRDATSPPASVEPAPTPVDERPVPGADAPWEEFCFLWCPDAYRPSRRYATEYAARVEAARLRAAYPARRFLVFRAVCIDFDERAGTHANVPGPAG